MVTERIGGNGDRDRGYGDRDRGYGDRDRGYGDRSRGYSDRDRGYNDRDRGYSNRDRGYDNRTSGYGNGDREYDDQSRGFGERDGIYGDSGRGFSNREKKFRSRGFSDKRFGDREFSRDGMYGTDRDFGGERGGRDRPFDERDVVNDSGDRSKIRKILKIVEMSPDQTIKEVVMNPKMKKRAPTERRRLQLQPRTKPKMMMFQLVMRLQHIVCYIWRCKTR
ncbi:U1 small nuclear ribonucleoprotein 70 kDa-like [Xenia sp. Carnegie-2017]|uniref:U1 small nuclear ribonucleoprotein 70 kDa-like n=1 Tax=Xenia sp. Carnegie-2017 TaxID=2897299 RepID=UPI001F03A61D|nr:U1 small nuclear ribonucleoprotein 70 kDa-like [Xenia sp. Carnegie-2017]